MQEGSRRGGSSTAATRGSDGVEGLWERLSGGLRAGSTALPSAGRPPVIIWEEGTFEWKGKTSASQEGKTAPEKLREKLLAARESGKGSVSRVGDREHTASQGRGQCL